MEDRFMTHRFMQHRFRKGDLVVIQKISDYERIIPLENQSSIDIMRYEGSKAEVMDCIEIDEEFYYYLLINDSELCPYFIHDIFLLKSDPASMNIPNKVVLVQKHFRVIANSRMHSTKFVEYSHAHEFLLKLEEKEPHPN